MASSHATCVLSKSDAFGESKGNAANA